MKHIAGVQPRRGITFFETIIVIAALAIVVVFLLPMISRPHVHSGRITCVNNLKQVGLAFLIFANDNDDRYPHHISESEGGVKEAVERGEVFRVFQVMSNELSVPKTVICPSDNRFEAGDFAALSNTNLSYFVGVEAVDTRPDMLLSGDRNLMIQNTMLSGLVPLQTNPQIQWGKGIHKHAGNIGLADGSVMQADAQGVVDQLKRSGDTNNLILFPQ